MPIRHPASYSPAPRAASYNPAVTGAVTDAGDASISRARSARAFKTQNQMDEARYGVTQWLCAQGVLGDAAKKTGAEIERWRQGSAAAAARLAEARQHLLALVNGNDPVAVALGRAASSSQDFDAARQAVTAAEDVATAFRVSPTTAQVQRSWLALWNSADRVWLDALDALEHTKGPEADMARSWLTDHLTRASDRQGNLARSGGNWIVVAG
jgi:hypothetical protein